MGHATGLELAHISAGHSGGLTRSGTQVLGISDSEAASTFDAIEEPVIPLPEDVEARGAAAEVPDHVGAMRSPGTDLPISIEVRTERGSVLFADDGQECFWMLTLQPPESPTLRCQLGTEVMRERLLSQAMTTLVPAQQRRDTTMMAYESRQ